MRAAWLLLAAGAAAGSGAAAQEQVAPTVPYADIARQAARGAPPAWRLRLGPVRVDELRPAGGDALLVGLRQDELELRNLEYLLVGRDDGAVRWRWKRDRDGASGTLVVLDETVVFHTTDKDAYTLAAVALATGAERWKRTYKGDTVTARPTATGSHVLLERRRKDRVDVLAVTLADGREAWSLRYKVPAGRYTQPPVIWDGGVLVFADGVTRVAPEDGRVLWTRPDLQPDSGDAPVQTAGDLAFVNVAAAVEALDLASGVTRWRADLPAYDAVTNVFPDSGVVFVRGVARLEGSGAILGRGVFLLSALDDATGAVRWQRRTLLPTLSNFVRHGDRVLVAGIDRLTAFDLATGTPRFEVETGATRLYPVRLRGYPDRVAFIGEHVLATFDPATGARRSWVGTTPLSQATTLAGLDAVIPQLQDAVATLRTGVQGAGGGMAGYASREMRRYQNLSNQYWRQAGAARSSGDYWGWQKGQMMSSMNSSWAKAMANVAFALSVVDLARAFMQYRLQREIARVEGLLERQLMFRDAVLTGNAAAETGDYAYRPHMQIMGGHDYAAVAVANLATGERRSTVVSANYLDHGLWNVLDAERGVLYHAGIGLDTAAYTWSAPHSAWPRRTVRTLETYLLATPVQVP